MDFPKVTVGNTNVKSLIEEFKTINRHPVNMKTYIEFAEILYSIDQHATLIWVDKDSVELIDIEETLKNYKNTVERIIKRRRQEII